MKLEEELLKETLENLKINGTACRGGSVSNKNIHAHA